MATYPTIQEWVTRFKFPQKPFSRRDVRKILQNWQDDKVELQQQNADLVAALTGILGSKAEQVFDSDGKTLKGYTLYVPKEQLWKVSDARQALAKAKEE